MVTGATGYIGKYITEELLTRGEEVRTLTGHLNRENPFDDQIEIYKYNFDKPEELEKSLYGVNTLYNTFWIRFSYGEINFDRAVYNSKILIDSAKRAGVKRIVHISIINADEKSDLPYFRGKGIVERYVKESRLSYAILRPTVLFGGEKSTESILINNIAWLLRNFPVFTIPGDGNYRVQPIYVKDLAKLAVDLGHKNENRFVNGVGPEIYTFNQLVHLIRNKINSDARIIHLPYWLPLIFSKIVGKSVNDIIITKDEMRGLMRDLLYSRYPPEGKTRFSSWLEEDSEFIGTEYASELKRYYLSKEV